MTHLERNSGGLFLYIFTISLLVSLGLLFTYGIRGDIKRRRADWDKWLERHNCVLQDTPPDSQVLYECDHHQEVVR